MADPIRQRGENFSELIRIMQRLLAADGCPWDREQTLETLKPFLLEEAHEVLEAIEGGDATGHCEELGDLLFQIVFQAELRAAEGAFGIEDVVRAIGAKMVRRHPHVFGDLKVSGSEEVLSNWGKLKEAEQREKGQPRTTLEGVPRALPALLRAQRIGEKAATVGFDWPDLSGVREKVDEELAELDQAIAARNPEAIADELGDLLFVLTRLGARCKVDPENALHRCIQRFQARFEFMEQSAAREGKALPGMSLEEMDRLWCEAKRHTALPKK